MMQYLDILKKIANDLDKQGLYFQADRIDYYLNKIAQEQEEQENMESQDQNQDLNLDFDISDEEITDRQELPERTNEILIRTTYLMLKELQDLYTSHLTDFDYLGQDNIEVFKASFDHLVNLLKTVLRDKTAEYDKEAVSAYRKHLKAIIKELNRSKKMKLTPAKVKVDKFYLYEELEMLVNKLQRLYDKGQVTELAPVIKKARSVRDTFGNIIKQVSEEIANADLIEIS